MGPLQINPTQHFRVLGMTAELNFEHLATLTASLCETPIAIISFTDDDDSWVKASFGVDPEDIPHCFMKTGGKHDSFDPFMNDHGLKFFAGVSIALKEERLGLVCVMDYYDRELRADQVETLKIISQQVLELIKLRDSYHDNLNKLVGGGLSIQTDKYIQNVAYKASIKSMAELSAGLSFRIRTHLFNLENIEKRILGLIHGESEIIQQMEYFGRSLSYLFNILDSLDRFVLAEKEKWMKPFVVNEIVNDIVNFNELKLKKYQITCKVEFSDEIICIGNITQFGDVVNALLINAIDACKDYQESFIKISISKDKHQGIIDVSDNGVGVPLGYLPFIFQPFFTTKGHGSLGIGLSIAQTLMHRHSGDVVLLKMDNPTTFRISFSVP